MFKDHIKNSGDTQSAWAARLCVSKGYMSGLLSGKKIPSLELAVRIERLTAGAVPAASWVKQDGEAA